MRPREIPEIPGLFTGLGTGTQVFSPCASVDFSSYNTLTGSLWPNNLTMGKSDEIFKSTRLVFTTTCKHFDILSTTIICFLRIFKISAFIEDTQETEMFTEGWYLLRTYCVSG